LTVAQLIAEADTIQRKATESGQYRAAISALKEKAVLSGLRVGR
jgi:hypothetical protein